MTSESLQWSSKGHLNYAAPYSRIHTWLGKNTRDLDSLRGASLPQLCHPQICISPVAGWPIPRESLFLWKPLLQVYNPIRRLFWVILLQDTLILDKSHRKGQIIAHPDTIHEDTLCSLVSTSNISSWSKQLQALGAQFSRRGHQDEVPLPLLWLVSLFSIPPCFHSSIRLTTDLQPWKPECGISPCLGIFPVIRIAVLWQLQDPGPICDNQHYS